MATRNIVTSPEASPEAAELSTEVSVCSLCLKQFSRYTCPRCELKYCSLSCYRSDKHLHCSEEFYKEEVVDSLRQQTGSREDRKKVMEILKRLQEQEVAGGDGGDGLEGEEVEEELSLHERFEGLDIQSSSLDSAAIWERLSERERKEFQSLLSEGHLGGLLDDYTPWWRIALPKVAEELSTAKKLPSLVKDVPSMDSLLHGKPPSPTIKYNVLNVLYAYVYVVRLYNGSHLELCSQASQNLLDISGVLSGCVQSFNSCQEGLTHAITAVQQNHELWNSSHFSQSVLEDLVHLLQESRSPFLLHALSEVHHLLEGGRREVKRSNLGPTEASKRLWLAKKKVLFLISWATELASSLRELAPVVQVEIENAKFLKAQFLKEKEAVEKTHTRTSHRTVDTKPLIEELT